MRLEELNWMDVENYLKTDNRIMVVLGACEQHAYLSLLTDVKIPMALADAASQESGVLVGPPVNFGVSPYFLDYPGTISLRVNTLLDLVEDYLSSLYQHGFRRILVLNGHGGNEPARGRISEICNRYEDLNVIWYSWWTSHSVEQVAVGHQLKPNHANWLEAFPFVRVAELPEKPKTPPHYQGLMGAKQTRAIFGDGSFGGEYVVSDEIMNELFYAAYEDVLHYLKFE